MSKKDKLIEKLITASGGWEKFLYQTLKEVCDDLAPAGYDAGVGGVVDEARLIVHAYEKKLRKDNGEPDVETTQPVPVITPLPRTVVPVAEDANKDDESVEHSELTYFEPASRSELKPRGMKTRVAVDKDAGASQGGLPIPTNGKIINRRNLFVGTRNGLELGRGSDDGQVRGQGVSGHVTVNGLFRLVFQDVNLGTAFLNYEVKLLPSKMTKKEFEEAVAVRNNLTVEKLHGVLQKLNKVVIPCGCTAELCFGWAIEDRAEVEKAAASQIEKQKARQIEATAALSVKPRG